MKNRELQSGAPFLLAYVQSLASAEALEEKEGKEDYDTGKHLAVRAGSEGAQVSVGGERRSETFYATFSADC